MVVPFQIKSPVVELVRDLTVAFESESIIAALDSVPVRLKDTIPVESLLTNFAIPEPTITLLGRKRLDMVYSWGLPGVCATSTGSVPSKEFTRFMPPRVPAVMISELPICAFPPAFKVSDL